MIKFLNKAKNRIASIGVQEDETEIYNAKARIFTYMVCIILIIQFILFIRELITKDLTGISIISTFIFCSLAILALHHYKNLRLTATVFNLFYSTIMGLYFIMVGHGDGIEYVFFIFMVTSVIFQRRDTFKFIFLGYNILLFVFGTIFLKYNQPILQRPGEQSDEIIMFITASICFFCIIYIFNKNLEKYYTHSLNLVGSLQNQNSKLIQANTELERFTHIASHDLKTPLRNIASFVGLMEKRLEQGTKEELDEYMAIVKENAMDMYELIEKTLEYSQVGQSEWSIEDIDLNQLVSKIREQLLSLYQNMVIKTKQLPVISADPYYIHKLFTNIIENGLKYNVSERKAVSIECEIKNNAYILSFQDNGIGIEEVYQDQIFTMFKRLHTKSNIPGTGIGLAICKKIVNDMGGRIWVESKAKVGSTFNLEIPMLQGHNQAGSIST